ncbi:hypothetical protein P3X46_032710 [Hevea brasiliensis]|uniref:Organ specific protein n=1 Tax=Hevea brasiliensis TaxID=3981 RepID=A0ABQ9KE40_HEVBR|nr:organ-specific protein S2 [Hevea brasiliensis]KAJ9135535.1 hypothetical protein P3X46_032710 [Hevea brasiliensis]
MLGDLHANQNFKKKKKSKSSFAITTIFLLLLVANGINARKDVGEYWKGAMKPTTENFDEHKKQKNFVVDFEPISNLWVYNDDALLRKKKSFAFVKDFEPSPNLSVYDKDDDLKDQKKSFANDFEPRPNVSIYNE